jgi:uncharacterized membrane protein YdbT with pleckstrin-like domain
MTDDWLGLAPGETVAWEGRPRLSAALPSVAVGALLALVGVVVAGSGVVGAPDVGLAVGGVMVGIGVLAAGGGLLTVARTRYRVTDRSIGLRSGVVGRTVRTVPLARVQDSSFTQDVTGRVLGYGTVTVETAGGDSFSFDRIDDPEAVRRLVDRRELRGETRSGQVPGDVEQWRAIRAEVRGVRAAFERR